QLRESFHRKDDARQLLIDDQGPKGRQRRRHQDLTWNERFRIHKGSSYLVEKQMFFDCRLYRGGGWTPGTNQVVAVEPSRRLNFAERSVLKSAHSLVGAQDAILSN